MTFLSYIGRFILPLLSLVYNNHMGCIHSVETPPIQVVLIRIKSLTFNLSVILAG